jgi:hypothetical protein
LAKEAPIWHFFSTGNIAARIFLSIFKLFRFISLPMTKTLFHRMKKLSLFLLILSSLQLPAQKNSEQDSSALQSIDGIVREVLKLVSGEKGKPRNWDALRNLFLPTARFTVLNHRDSALQPVETVGLEEFIELMHDDYYEQGYLEYEISKKIEQYNGIASVFQSYHGRDSEKLEETGINCYQLVYFRQRWWVASLLWTGDSNGVKVPKKYLRPPKIR